MFIYYPGLNVNVEKNLIGGKAKNLMIMQKHGYSIPEWFVITTEAFKYTVGSTLKESCKEDILGLIKNTEIPEDLLQQIYQTLKELNLTNKFLAVRSSAKEEDGLKYSYAGQFESFLYVKEEDLIDKIKDVWSSAFSIRANLYRQKNNLKAPFSMAVLVQEMIDSEVSGVAFGMDPLSGDENVITISSVYGLGEGIVSGQLNADNYYVKGDKIDIIPSKNSFKISFNKKINKGTATAILTETEKQALSLNNKQVLNIANQVRKLNKLFGIPQDVEWAIIANKLYILQARPVTIMNQQQNKKCVKIIWDNSNIVESYAGVTTPLTFSFIKDVYTEVYKQFCRIMGVEEELIEKNNNIFQMIGLINGRVYYNLLNWYKVLSLLPGYSINAEFMEQMMGVKERLELPPEVIQSTKNKYFRVLKLVIKLLINLIRLPQNISNFYSLLNDTLNPLESLDWLTKTPEELVSIYYHLERKLLKNWQVPLVNDFFCMIFYGLLKKIIIKWNIDQSGMLQNDLLSGDGEIISIVPIKRIRDISNLICQDESLQNLFLNNDENKILTNLTDYAVYKDFMDYLNRFGNRCMGELKLETISYKDNPEPLISLIKSYVIQGYFDQEQAGKKAIEIRKVAETEVANILKSSPIKQFIFKYILKQARLRVRHRENLRFERTRLFSIIRNLFLAIGKHFSDNGIIDHQRDIFYLTKEEIFNYINGTATTVHLKALIDLRKYEFNEYHYLESDSRFETSGIVCKGNVFKSNNKENLSQKADLTGIGCCSGLVKGQIKIVNNLDEAKNLNGCILVAEKTDPGWVPLFAVSKGILVERGSILSHSAIVAREMGIPAIVGINNLMESLIDGEIVEMDGSKGTIKLFRGDHG